MIFSNEISETSYFTRLSYGECNPIKEKYSREPRSTTHRYYLFVSASERFIFTEINRKANLFVFVFVCSDVKLVQRKEQEKLKGFSNLLTACQDQIAFMIVFEYISKYGQRKMNVITPPRKSKM